ncbi:Baculoviral Iap Repeat-Containing Protein 6 [Manis pentadactyla]|nr:Baculoviral Iap Repeat-Containing Protein 6 [Manis pentadactyla]
MFGAMDLQAEGEKSAYSQQPTETVVNMAALALVADLLLQVKWKHQVINRTVTSTQFKWGTVKPGTALIILDETFG